MCFIQERSRDDACGEIQMLTNWTSNEHTTKRRPTAAMYGVCLSGNPILSAASIFTGRLGQRSTSIDNRHIRH